MQHVIRMHAFICLVLCLLHRAVGTRTCITVQTPVNPQDLKLHHTPLEGLHELECLKRANIVASADPQYAAECSVAQLANPPALGSKTAAYHQVSLTLSTNCDIDASTLLVQVTPLPAAAPFSQTLLLASSQPPSQPHSKADLQAFAWAYAPESARDDGQMQMQLHRRLLQFAPPKPRADGTPPPPDNFTMDTGLACCCSQPPFSVCCCGPRRFSCCMPPQAAACGGTCRLLVILLSLLVVVATFAALTLCRVMQGRQQRAIVQERAQTRRHTTEDILQALEASVTKGTTPPVSASKLTGHFSITSAISSSTSNKAPATQPHGMDGQTDTALDGQTDARTDTDLERANKTDKQTDSIVFAAAVVADADQGAPARAPAGPQGPAERSACSANTEAHKEEHTGTENTAEHNHAAHNNNNNNNNVQSTDADGLGDDEFCCPVCLEEPLLEDWRLFRCGHGVCYTCLKGMAQRLKSARKAMCPICRGRVLQPNSLLTDVGPAEGATGGPTSEGPAGALQGSSALTASTAGSSDAEGVPMQGPLEAPSDRAPAQNDSALQHDGMQQQGGNAAAEYGSEGQKIELVVHSQAQVEQGSAGK